MVCSIAGEEDGPARGMQGLGGFLLLRFEVLGSTWVCEVGHSWDFPAPRPLRATQERLSG
eukprot:2247052-Amphidinium_carterae.1